MGHTTEAGLSSRERLTRGLRYSAVGPVDVTRGVIGLTAHSAGSAAAGVRRSYRAARTARGELAADTAIVKQAVAELHEARKRPRRLWVFGGLGLAAVVGGAVAFGILRRSMQPDPSPLPPSVEVTPKP